MQSILVIDDQPELRTTLQAVLSRAGYQVQTAVDGSEAIRSLAGLKVDLVLTDILMPGKDGIEVVMALRKSQPKLPVIVMTGGGHIDGDFYLKLSRDLGAKGILQKPFSNELLLQTIAFALPPVAA